MNKLSNFFRFFLIILLIAFSVSCIIISSLVREIESPPTRAALSFTSNFENRFYDWRMTRSLDSSKKSKDIVLATVDDPSIKTIGRYPWPRAVWAQIINNLKNYGAKVLAFDVMFSEEERVCSNINGDELLSESIESFQSIEGNKVILGYGIEPYPLEGYTMSDIPEDLFNYIVDNKSDNDNVTLSEYWVSSTTYPIPKLLAAGPALGYISNREDNDGVFRYYPVAANVGSLYFPSLGLAAYTSFTNDSTLLRVGSDGSAEFIINEQDRFNLNTAGETRIRWIGGREHFDSVALGEIYQKANDPKLKEKLAGKLVFIGSTAIGAHDFRNTSIDPKLPGVYAHMTVSYMLKNRHFFKPSNESTVYSLWFLAIGLLLLMIIQFFKNPILDLLGIAAIILGSFYIDTHFFLPEGYEIRLFFTYFCFISVYSWNTFLSFSQSNQEKKMIKGTFARFVAPTVVDEMLDDPSKVKIGGQRKDITCMFSDVRDFTTISEQLDAQQLSSALNQYMSKMTNIVFETDGTVDKYIGDAIVALWGAPLDVGNHAEKAVNAAIKMIELMPEVNKEFAQQGLPEFKYGIGLNSGECSVGNMGSDKIFSYTALGDNMNLGARLEGLCKPYGSLITISEYTYERLDKKRFKCRKLDRVRVKGKTQPVEIYEVLTILHPLWNDEESYQLFNKSVEDFHSMRFEDALTGFTMLHQKYPEDVSTNRLKDMSHDFIKNHPGDDWDGVYTFKTK